MIKKNYKKDQFNIPFNPSRDNLDICILFGYKHLTSTEKIIYLCITSLNRNGDNLTKSDLIKILPFSQRTIYYALAKLSEEELIGYDKVLIIPFEPNIRDKQFQNAIL